MPWGLKPPPEPDPPEVLDPQLVTAPARRREAATTATRPRLDLKARLVALRGLVIDSWLLVLMEWLGRSDAIDPENVPIALHTKWA
jgi:hypothetical protein